MMSKKSPQLRFEGFTDDWEEHKLKDVVEKQIKGKAQFEKLAPGDVEYLDTSRLNGGQAILTNGLKDVTLDDVLILWDGSKAGTVYHGFEGSLGSTLKAYRTSADSKFVYQYLKRYQDNIYNNYRTPNIPHVQKDFLDVFTISVPRSDEQAKIGSFFKQLDDTIALHQRKLDLLKEQKKGFLQKMFPKNGAKVPELRFAGFADDWEERKLGELLKSAYQGINTAGDKVIYSEKGVEILQSKHITSGYITFDDTRFLDKKRYSEYFPKYVPKKHDILFANIGTIGPSTVVETNKEFLIAWNILKMTPNENVNSKFIELFLQILNEKHYYEKITTGNATKFVNKDAILNIELCISSFKEQEKIGSFFKQIDDTIDLHQRKLDLLKEQKKGFLQKMFV
ncbi:restriction endonuclease subunit S [Enterococcus lactis]|uniref:restriction endonuclease subunit S n=1 Tax=Enterococcus lactis TaxID=357441 RepID=UPI003C130198